MLLIPCPYCGERPELEFVYGGQAHIARPADPAAVERRRTGRSSCTCATTRAACTPSAGGTPMAAARFFNALRDTDHRPFPRHLQSRRAAAGAGAGSRRP